MSPSAVALLVLFGAAAAAFGYGYLLLRRGAAEAERSLARIRIEDVPRLTEECERVFRERLGAPLAGLDLEGACELLERVTRSQALKRAFRRDELAWYFVQPVGAYVGELIRAHGRAVWAADPAGGVLLEVTLPEGRTLRSRPFDKVLRHRLSGQAGGLRAYIRFAAGRDPGAPRA